MKKTILFLSILVLIITFSEILYHLSNKTPQLLSFYLYLAKLEAQKENPQGAMKFLGKAAKAQISRNKKIYPTLIPDYQLPDLSYFPSVSLDESYPVSDKLTKIYYDLGLVAYKNQKTDLATSFWQTAVYLNPELSHTQVELANFYLSKGDEKKARETFEFCFKFNYPQKHCRDYFEANFILNTPQEPGFLESEIERYYQVFL